MSTASTQIHAPEKVFANVRLREAASIEDLVWSTPVKCQIPESSGSAGPIWALMAYLAYTPGDEDDAGIVVQGRFSDDSPWITLGTLLGTALEAPGFVFPVHFVPVPQFRFAVFRSGGTTDGAGRVTLDVEKASNVLFGFPFLPVP